MRKNFIPRQCFLRIFVCCMAFTAHGLNAGDSSALKNKNLDFSGYMEMYYSYDLGQPSDHLRPDFFYSFNRHNEVNLNLGYVKAAYKNKHIRWNAALMGGTYSQYNLSAEPALLRNIMEANAGFKLSRKVNLWLDAGVMPSHIGFESAIGKDCWNLSRSILADNSPYFETGAKVSYTSGSEKWNAAAVVMNGWQRIQWDNQYSQPSVGTQLNYKADSAHLYNWSTFIGNIKGNNGDKQLRIFNNFYGQIQLTDRWGAIVGLDIGLQQKRDSAGRYKGWSVWTAPVVIVKYTFSKRYSLAGRVEYYADKDRVMILGNNKFGFSTIGVSSNLDVRIRDNVLWRLETRVLGSPNKEYMNNGQPSNNNVFFTTALSVAF